MTSIQRAELRSRRQAWMISSGMTILVPPVGILLTLLNATLGPSLRRSATVAGLVLCLGAGIFGVIAMTAGNSAYAALSVPQVETTTLN